MAAIDRAPASASLAPFASARPVAAADDALGIASASARALATETVAGDTARSVVDGTRAPLDGTRAPLDDTADIPEVLSTALARRAELALLLAREQDQTQQAKIDRMRADFDNAAQERTEHLREMNALRDMALEQMKKDDEVLKKFITMI